ncbi:pyridoxal phosphate-dependent aminotransferase [Sutterella sp.]|uniref:pyridoxal phosphate-dependent aminotransferase n=1 Tax=Sutterella sp. TaxID=1981025 RepID=UPI0026DF2158|nr:aminotransferase class I/II-fold pyridoxal phosphate-dependent enzyme [Sutterella sp.]MDO5531129.1 aminotransferase class I/II-fold pyridoxal phosphate-dependent enzyme [Sutterella sp.]
MITLSNRSSTFTDSVIRRMSRVCAQYGALNLAQGFPDYNPPRPMLDRLAQVAHEGPHQYATTWGAQNFREALCEKVKHFSGLEYDPNSEVAVTCGGTEAMMAAVLATVNPGDKVAIFSPFYENYGADAILSGAEPIFVPLKPPTFAFDEEELRAAFRAGAKALILCNPSNPSGKVFTREELLKIAAIVKEFDAFVITDEVYEHIIYAPAVHTHFAALPGMREHTIICNSLSKTYSITGWRLGYVMGPAEPLDRVRKVHDFLTVGAAAPLQEAAVVGLRFGDDYYEQLQAEYTHRRNLFLSGLDSLGLRYFKPEGTYFVLVDISRFGYDDDYQFCLDLAEKVKLGAVPGSSFFREPENRYIRLHFAKGDDRVLEDAINRLSKVSILQK